MGRNEKSSHSVSGASGREGSRPQAFRLEAPPLRFVGGASAFYASAQVTVNFFSTLGPREDLQRVLAHHLSFRCAAWPVILAPGRKGRAFSGMPMWRRSVGKLVVAQSVKYLCSGPMKHQKIGECQDSPSVDKNVSGLVRASDRYLSPAADDCCTGFLGPTDIQSLGDRANIQALRRHSTPRSGNMLATARHISSPTARLTAVVDRLGARRLDRAQTYSIT